MRLREVMVFPEILDSRKVCSMKPFAQLFYRNLMHACDGAGVFENDPEMLCKALYPRAQDRVTPEAVATWLMECRQAGLIRFHTDDKGRALGEFEQWLQLDGKRKRRYQHSREQQPGQLAGLFSTADPPAPPAPPKKKKGIEVSVKAPPKPDTPRLTDDQWLDGLAAAHPEINVRAELTACLVKYPQAGRKFFEEQWLPNAEPPMKGRRAGSAEPIPEPPGFVEWFKHRYEKQPTPWDQLTREHQAYYVRQMKQ